MTLYHIPLVLALAAGLLYGAVLCVRPSSLLRTVVKTGAVGGLAVWVWLVSGPSLLIAALGLSAIGDAFLAGDKTRWLLPGMAAFFAAHIAYVVLFRSSGLDPSSATNIAAQAVLALATLAMIIWLWPKLGAFRLPVLAYSAVIFSMGMLAILLPDLLRLATWGALAFIASDAILSHELFAKPDGAAPHPIAARLVWGLYFGGQAMIAAAFMI